MATRRTSLFARRGSAFSSGRGSSIIKSTRSHANLLAQLESSKQVSRMPSTLHLTGLQGATFDGIRTTSSSYGIREVSFEQTERENRNRNGKRDSRSPRRACAPAPAPCPTRLEQMILEKNANKLAETGVLDKKVEDALHVLGLHKDDDPNTKRTAPSRAGAAVEDATVLILRQLKEANQCIVVLVFDNMEFVDEASWKILYTMSKVLRDSIIVGTITTPFSTDKHNNRGMEHSFKQRAGLQSMSTRHRKHTNKKTKKVKVTRGENVQNFVTQFKSSVVRVHLGPLESEDGLEVVKAVLGICSFPEGVWTGIHEVAEGNPVFYEQVAKALVEAGKIDIVPVGGDVPGESETQKKMMAVLGSDESNFELPSTLQNLVTMRVDRLSPMQQKVGTNGGTQRSR